MFYGILADIVGLVHFAYVSFVVVGLLLIFIGIPLGWRWTRDCRFRLVHLFMILVVALESLGGIMCPLTTWENNLRLWAGQPPGGDSFIADFLNHVMFFDADVDSEWLGNDHWVFKSGYVSFAALVVMTFFLAPPMWRGKGQPVRPLGARCVATVLLATASFISLYTAWCMENYKRDWDVRRQQSYQANRRQNPAGAAFTPENRIPVYVLALAGAACALTAAGITYSGRTRRSDQFLSPNAGH